MASKAEAVEALTELGSTEYEARCFVALSQLSEGTAQEISQVSEVPQSRVYDIADSLFQRGLWTFSNPSLEDILRYPSNMPLNDFAKSTMNSSKPPISVSRGSNREI